MFILKFIFTPHAILAMLLCGIVGCASNDRTHARHDLSTITPNAYEMATADLLIQFLTSKEWADFAWKYAEDVKKSHKMNNMACSSHDMIPLVFLEKVDSSLCTSAGNPINGMVIPRIFLTRLQSPEQLKFFLTHELPLPKYRKLYEKYNSLKQANQLDWPENLPRIRQSRYSGIDKEMAADAVDYIINDLRCNHNYTEAPDIKLPRLAISFKMWEEGEDSERRLYASATIMDHQNNNEVSGEGIVVWQGITTINN